MPKTKLNTEVPESVERTYDELHEDILGMLAEVDDETLIAIGNLMFKSVEKVGRLNVKVKVVYS